MKLTESFPELETERLILRELRKSDAAQIFELRSNPIQNKFIDRPRATSIEDAEAFITRIGTYIAKQESLLWAIQVKGESTLAGTVLLWHFNHESDSVELGYELLAAKQGKGIMNEAIIKVLEFAFSKLLAGSVKAWTHPGNKRSISVLEKLGFTRDEDAEKSQPADAIENIYRLAAANYSYK
jgi:[ribosomal protein S5]-alanine N-acetyltransferase